MLALRLPTELEERLNKLAKLSGRTKSYYVRRAIVQELDNLERIYMPDESRKSAASSERKSRGKT